MLPFIERMRGTDWGISMKVFMNVDVHSRFIVNVITMNLGGGGGGVVSPCPQCHLRACMQMSMK